MFCHYWQKLRIQNGRHFWGGEIFFENCRVYFRYPMGRKFLKIALSRMVKDRSKFVFFHFWQKFENSKWLPFLGRGKFFENCKEYISDTLWVENFDKITLSRMVKDRSKFVFFHFGQKFENSKWLPFLGRGKFF